MDIRQKLAGLVAKQVTATGMLSEKDGYGALYISGADIAAAK